MTSGWNALIHCARRYLGQQFVRCHHLLATRFWACSLSWVSSQQGYGRDVKLMEISLTHTLWPTDAMWQHRYKSTLAQVTASCLTKQFTNRCLRGKLWHLQHHCAGVAIVYHRASEMMFMNLIHDVYLEIILKLQTHNPRPMSWRMNKLNFYWKCFGLF